MRTLLLMLFLPVFCFGQASQNDPPERQVIQDTIQGTSMQLKDGRVVFKKAYSSSLKKEALMDKLSALLSLIKSFRFNEGTYQSGEQVIGKLFRHKINADRYGGVYLIGALSALTDPLNAMVLVQVKDFKYQVVITEISFGEVYADSLKRTHYNDVMLEKYVTRNNASKLKSGKSNVKLLQSIDQEFSDLFNLQKSNLAADF